MKEIKVKIVSERGHDTLLLQENEALERIQNETTSKGKWCYIDGSFVKSENISSEMLQNATDITLVTQLAGG